jgi:hypothetical protein
MKNPAYLSPAPAPYALTDAHHIMTDLSPHAAAPLPYRFPWQNNTYWYPHSHVTQALDELPVATEEILPARDREWVLRILTVPYSIRSVRHDRFIDGIFEDTVLSLFQDVERLERLQERWLPLALTDPGRNTIMRRIAEVQTRVDEQRAAYARRIRDSLGLIEQYNRELYADFRRPVVQAVPDQIARATAAEDWTELRNALFYFLRYAAYAPHRDIAQTLDRLAEALTTRRLPAVPMRPPTDYPNEEPQMGTNWILQMHRLRDACQLIHDDPRATHTIQPAAVGVLHSAPLFEDQLQDAGMFVRINPDDFNLLGDHMIRRARDRAWERVRERFALRLVSWAQRYPECRLAALAHAPVDVARYIAALRFPYAPYPN